MLIGLLFGLSVAVALGYVGFLAWDSHGFPDTMTSVVYKLPKGWRRWMWTLWMWVITLLMAPAIFKVVPESWHAAAHCFVTCQLLVALLPLMKEKDNTPHHVMAALDCVFSQICVVLICPALMLGWFPLLMAFQRTGNDKALSVAESQCWLMLVMAVTIKLSML